MDKISISKPTAYAIIAVTALAVVGAAWLLFAYGLPGLLSLTPLAFMQLAVGIGAVLAGIGLFRAGTAMAARGNQLQKIGNGLQQIGQATADLTKLVREEGGVTSLLAGNRLGSIDWKSVIERAKKPPGR